MSGNYLIWPYDIWKARYGSLMWCFYNSLLICNKTDNSIQMALFLTGYKETEVKKEIIPDELLLVLCQLCDCCWWIEEK